MKKKYSHYCQRCTHWWESDTTPPAACPKCTSRYWDTPRSVLEYSTPGVEYSASADLTPEQVRAAELFTMGMYEHLQVLQDVDCPVCTAIYALLRTVAGGK